MKITALLWYAIACSDAVIALDTITETQGLNKLPMKKNLRQDHRHLATCSEDDTFFVITSCENVCGINGLEFHAELFSSLCEFVSDSDAVEDEARALGCPNVGGSWLCAAYSNLRDEIEARNLDVMCEFCTSWSASGSMPTNPPPATPPPVTPAPTPASPPPPTHAFFGGITDPPTQAGPTAPVTPPTAAVTPPPVTPPTASTTPQPVTTPPTIAATTPPGTPAPVVTTSSPVVEGSEPPTTLTTSASPASFVPTYKFITLATVCLIVCLN